MDVRDRMLIREYGYDMAQWLLKLAADPTWDLLAQIKHSEEIAKIRQRSHFRQKTPIANISTIC
jgi:predicted nuclease of restriction endonuclease-like RecB superfamily